MVNSVLKFYGLHAYVLVINGIRMKTEYIITVNWWLYMNIQQKKSNQSILDFRL